jgi:phage terminase Nu1 subunit (DNA packaging protein)
MKSLDDRVPGPVIAGMLGISVVTFHQLVGKGVVERQGRAGYPLRDTVKACCEYYRKIASGRSEEGEQKVLASARARAALAQAEQMELRTQIARGNYIPRNALVFGLQGFIIEMRQEFLHGIPPAAVATVIGYAPGADTNAIYEAVDNVVRDALSRFADGTSNLLADNPPQAAAVNDAKPTRARRWRGPTPRGISHDQNREGGEVSPGGSFDNAAVARSRRGHAGPDISGVSVDHAAPDGRNQRRNGIALSTR